MKSKRVIRIFTGMILLAGMLAAASLAASGPRTIDTAHLHRFVVDNAYRYEAGRERQTTIIDSRSREEYEQAHIFSAISVPTGEFERSKDLLPEDKGAPLVVYDNDPEPGTSRKWAEKAAALGYVNIAVYSDGFSAWKKNKMPVVPLRDDR